MVHALGGAALAGVVTTPEIDGSAVTAGLGLLAAGVLLLRARKSR
jgi:MYXO-CTERM domain-containing protein